MGKKKNEPPKKAKTKNPCNNETTNPVTYPPVIVCTTPKPCSASIFLNLPCCDMHSGKHQSASPSSSISFSSSSTVSNSSTIAYCIEASFAISSSVFPALELFLKYHVRATGI